MSDNTIKTMVYIFAGILSIYPVIELLFKKKKSWWYKSLILIVLCVFWYVTIRYKGILDREALEANKKSDSFELEAKKLTNDLKVKTDSTNHYLQALKDSIKSMNVTEDKRKTFNNYIDKIETLNQY